MKKLQLNILFFLTLITNICLADVPLLNNNPATIGKGNFDFLIGGTLPLLPPVDDNFDFFTPLIGNLNFGYGITDKIYMQLGSLPCYST